MTAFLYICMTLSTGAVVGYLTNWLAISMLFRPYTAKFIGQYQIPFTPGVLPRERENFAEKTAEAVVKLLDPSYLKERTPAGDILIRMYAMLNNYFDHASFPLNFTPQWIRREIFLSLLTNLIDGLPTVLNSNTLPDMVKERVLSISNKEIEHAVRTFANLQLRWITILGAVLGGLIGLVQGCIGLFFW